MYLLSHLDDCEGRRGRREIVDVVPESPAVWSLLPHFLVGLELACTPACLCRLNFVNSASHGFYNYTLHYFGPYLEQEVEANGEEFVFFYFLPHYIKILGSTAACLLSLFKIKTHNYLL